MDGSGTFALADDTAEALQLAVRQGCEYLILSAGDLSVVPESSLPGPMVKCLDVTFEGRFVQRRLFPVFDDGDGVCQKSVQHAEKGLVGRWLRDVLRGVARAVPIARARWAESDLEPLDASVQAHVDSQARRKMARASD